MRANVFQVPAALIGFFVVILLTGCGTLPSGKRWADDATLLPGWNRLGRSALNAATSPRTWLPLAGAGMLHVGDMDKKAAEWASDHRPIFGDMETATQASDDGGHWLEYWMYATLLATPSGPDPAGWVVSKAKGIGIEWASVDITEIVTSELKSVGIRERPDETDNFSFPSGHASRAFSRATLASRNIRAMNLPGPVEYSLRGATEIMAAGTGWARVEAGVHYPSDVLAGAALGYFLSAFIHDAFLGEPEDGVMIQVVPTGDQVEVQASWRF
ncbi:MAG: phosphatase PAP2 family protein [Kiritimatiellia bacterium]